MGSVVPRPVALAPRKLRTRLHNGLSAFTRATFDPEEVAGLLFAQHRLESHQYFLSRLGQSHTVPASEFPHLAFLQDPIGGRAVFDEYLNLTWGERRPGENTRAGRDSYLDRFWDRYRQVSAGRRREDPIRVVRRRDGRFGIYDGNHRSAIALALGTVANIRVMSTSYWLREVARLSATAHLGDYGTTPSQALYDGTRKLVAGEDPDTRARFDGIRAEDIRRKRVVVFDAGIGASVFVAADQGAGEVIGVDADPGRVVAAIRLNAYFAVNASFLIGDLRGSLPTVADTILWFPPHAATPEVGRLKVAMSRCRAKVVYFEGRPGTTADEVRAGLDLPDVEVVRVSRGGTLFRISVS